jgi:hypothetical protein
MPMLIDTGWDFRAMIKQAKLPQISDLKVLTRKQTLDMMASSRRVLREIDRTCDEILPQFLSDHHLDSHVY